MSETEQAAMRVAIAKDAIEQIKAGRLIPQSGVYLRVEGKSFYRVDPRMQIKELVAGTRCTVCALGAVFIAAVDKRNAIAVREIVEGDGCTSWTFRNYLQNLFSREQLCLIEMAFEQNDSPGDFGEFGVVVGRDEVLDCWRWVDEVPESRDRLTAILENVVRNDGTFKPADLPAAIVA
jgi:hypothetical protein